MINCQDNLLGAGAIQEPCWEHLRLANQSRSARPSQGRILELRLWPGLETCQSPPQCVN